MTAMDFNLKNDKFWFGLVFALALVVRLLRLGEVPLSEAEAAWALQAFDLTRGLPVDFGPQPGYINLTALVFFVLQASNFAARFIPALAGAALVLAPFFFRDKLGEKAALTLAFLLAFEPGLLALSRQAGSPILAVSLLLLAWGTWRTGYVRLSGFLAGLALLSGSALYFGLAGLGLAFALTRVFVPQAFFSFEQERARPALFFALGTYLVFGSLFLFAPGGLAAGLAGLLGLFNGLLDWNGVYFWQLPLALLVYQFPALILTLVSLARLFQRRDPLVIFLGSWLLTSLLVASIFPSRQVSDLIWTLIPLSALAALEIVRWLIPIASVAELQAFPDEQGSGEAELRPVVITNGVWETLGVTALTAILLAFSWLNFTGVALITFDPAATQMRWLVTAGALVLLVLSVILVAFGWSIRVAAQGFAWGGLASLAVYSLAMASFSANLRPLPTVEMWPDGPQSPAAGVLLDQVRELSLLSHGADASLKITLVGFDSPAVRWLLRDWRVITAQALSFESVSDIIITPGNAFPPELEAAYRGAIFPWRSYPVWGQASTSEWLRWVSIHDLPQSQETLLLWARSDLFPDSQNPVP